MDFPVLWLTVELPTAPLSLLWAKKPETSIELPPSRIAIVTEPLGSGVMTTNWAPGEKVLPIAAPMALMTSAVLHLHSVNRSGGDILEGSGPPLLDAHKLEVQIRYQVGLICPCLARWPSLPIRPGL